jgi:signal transduction histidine kinase
MLLIELAQVQKMAVLEPELVQRLTSLRNQVREISSDINCISHNLHLTRLDQLGLEASLRGMCREFEAPGKLKIDIHLDGDLSKLPEDVNLSVYRIAQEAVRNCAKHSGAGSVCLVLVRTDNELQLSVSDDGHGFDTSSRAVQEGLGFTSMHERARIVGGSISINSRTGHGTIVKVLIGLKSEDSKSTEIGTNVWDLRRSFGLGLSER